jgi:hypothetical protein
MAAAPLMAPAALAVVVVMAALASQAKVTKGDWVLVELEVAVQVPLRAINFLSVALSDTAVA